MVTKEKEQKKQETKVDEPVGESAFQDNGQEPDGEETKSSGKSTQEPEGTSHSQTLSIKEIDEFYEEIKKAAGSSEDDTGREKELVKKAIEAERKRIAQEEAKKKEAEEKESMKSELEQMKAQLEELKNTSGGRRTQVPNNNPFEKTEDNKMKIPKADFDRAVNKFITGK